jgi:hypothetical protein
MYQQSGKLGLLSGSDDLKTIPKAGISHQVVVPYYLLLVGSLLSYSWCFETTFNFNFFVPFWTYFNIVRDFPPAAQSGQSLCYISFQTLSQ